MSISIQYGPFDVPGLRLGHWTDPESRTGCSVLIADTLVPAAVEVRGGSPGTRETALLGPGRMVHGVDAILLTGGSAFGLSAADGVMQLLQERGRGFPTPVIPVPIVSAAVVFDLAGDDPRWPEPAAGYAAAEAASDRWVDGRIGAGSATSVSKALGRELAVAAGLGIAQVTCAAGTVSAVFVNNAVGDIYDDQTGMLITTPGGLGRSTEEIVLSQDGRTSQGENTVIGAIWVDRPLDHDALVRMTVAGHAGIARVIRPAHTPSDGDTVFAAAPDVGETSGNDLMQLTTAAQIATARALVRSVSAAGEPV